MPTSRVGPVLAVAALLGVAVATPASAAVATRVDPAGDAAPRYDIVRTTYVNTPTRFTIKVKLTRLRLDVANQVEVLMKPASDPRRIIGVHVVRRANGRVATELWSIKGPNMPTFSCTMTTRWAAETPEVTITVPQTCLRRWAGNQTRVVTMTANPVDEAEQDDTRGASVAQG